MTPGGSRQYLIHIHADVNELGRVYQANVAVQCDIASAVSVLAQTAAPVQLPWQEQTQSARADHAAFCMAPALSPEHSGVDMAAVVQPLSEYCPDVALLTNGPGT